MDFHQKAYICVHVFEKTRAVLLVTRPDGDWCFLCGEEHENEASAYMIVGVGHLMEHDATLSEVLDLREDWDAERTRPGGPWTRKPIESK